MEKVNLKIEDFEDKKTTAGKRYTRFKTDQGWMSCFDLKACEALKSVNDGESIFVEIAVDEEKGFKNIKRLATPGEKSDSETKPEQKKLSGEAPMSSFKGNTTTMYVSYAKDIFCALRNTEALNQTTSVVIMAHAIELVKQAKIAFE